MYQKQLHREKLVQVLDSVAAALAVKDLIPILSSFCFADGYVTTFDGYVTMRAPCPDLEGFEGAVRGPQLLSWLGRVKVDSVKLACADNESRWSAGKSRVSLPVLERTWFQYEIPKLDEDAHLHCFLATLSFSEALEAAGRSMGTDESGDWRMGVTVAFDDDGALFYATDNVTCTRANATFACPVELRGLAIILPPRFVELLRKERAAPVLWAFSKALVAVELPGDRWIYCSTFGVGHVAMHRGVFDAFDWDRGFCDVPPTFKEHLVASTVVATEKASATVKLSFTGNEATIEAKTDLGEFVESFEVTGAEQPHDPVEVSPSLLIRASAGLPLMRVTDSGIQFKSDVVDVLCSVERAD